MTTIRITEGDYGYGITYTCHDNDGSVLDVSSYTTRTLKIGRRGEATSDISLSMGFVTDGTNGQVRGTFTNGSTDIEGYYDAEIILSKSGEVRKLKAFTIQFIPKLA